MPPTRLRFTVAHKIWAGLALIVVVGITIMLLIYLSLNQVEKDVNRLAAVEAPINAAAYEMELNVNGIGFATLKYLATGTPQYRAMAEQDELDFVRFHGNYARLVRTQRERALGEQMGRLYQQFQAVGRDLIAKRDEQEALFGRVAAQFEQIDRIIDRDLELAFASQGVRRNNIFEQRADAANIEAEAAEIGFVLVNYQRRTTPDARRAIFQKLDEFQGGLAAFRGLNLSPEEARQAGRIQAIFNNARENVGEVVSLEDYFRDRRQRFIDLRLTMDSLLDDEIQVLALRGLETPRRQAEAATEQLLTNIRLLVPIYILAAGMIGLLLVKLITRPLRRLRKGTLAVGHGDMAYRIEPTANDEFGDLAVQFNLMVNQLQDTTVSKELLEESEEKLKGTVASLRHEIKERKQSERERENLQVELRRAETMSAMGSLVAGVAHEVRNPLFGITSTLDAMTARLGDREEHRRYLEVLHSQANRLNKLMEDLLDYGRPVAPDLETGSLNNVIARSIELCTPMANHLGVGLSLAGTAKLPSVRLARGRLEQVFQNLIVNSLQHSPRGETVTVELSAVRDGVRRAIDCAVIDSGSGFAEEDLPRVFEPFFTRRHRGTGLGLAIVKRIVDEHGGKVFAGNRPEGGVIVTVRLPIDHSRSA